MALITHIKGDTFNGLCFNILINDVPLDLTDIDIKVHFRLGSKTGCDVHKYTIGNGITVTDAMAGEFSLLKDTIINWKTGRWYFDVEFIWPSGKVKTYYSNILVINQDVTK